MSTSKDFIDTGSGRQEKLNNAAKVFLDRAREYNEMMEEAQTEYRIGMRHLANMMGSDPDTFTQADADVSKSFDYALGIYLMKKINFNLLGCR